METFNYTSLDRATHEIRLIRILQGSDSVFCELFHANLEDNPRYVALSYTWGNASCTRPVNLNGSIHRVTENLYSALQHLHTRHGHQALWIDAICINQEDVVERSAQVQIMRTIFQKATRILIWLGPGNETSDEALTRTEIIGRAAMKLLPELQMQDLLLILMEPSHPQRQHFLTAFDQALHDLGFQDRCRLRCLLTLLEHPYWRRAWILQEVAVGKDPVIMCGSRTVSWRHFVILVVSLSESLRDCAMSDPNKCQFWRADGVVYDIPWWVCQSSHCSIGTLAKTREMVQSNVSNGQLAFTKVLDEFTILNRFLCKDPRDKVFSILGLAEDRESIDLEVNYADSTQVVFSKTVAAVIKCSWHSHCLAILSCTQPLRGLDSLPSWVPDWTLPMKRNVIGKINSSIYSADKGRGPALFGVSLEFVLPNHSTLRLIGTCFDTVYDVGRSWSELGGLNHSLTGVDWPTVNGLRSLVEALARGGTYVEDHEARMRWVDNCRSLCNYQPGRHRSAEEMQSLQVQVRGQGSCPYATDIERYEALGRTLIADWSLSSSSPAYFGIEPQAQESRAGVLELRMFQALIGHAEPPENFLTDPNLSADTRRERFVQHFLLIAGFMAEQRRPVLSKKGYFGLAPESTQPGDLLVVCAGSSVPFVLRKVVTLGCISSYKFIGECYIHGVMDGEMVEGDLTGKMDLFPLL